MSERDTSSGKSVTYFGADAYVGHLNRKAYWRRVPGGGGVSGGGHSVFRRHVDH